MDVTQEAYEFLPTSQYLFAVWNLIIRPPRCRYTERLSTHMYPSGRWILGKTPVERSDFSLQNGQGLHLVVTVFEPLFKKVPAEKACVIYCHGNGASRLNGFNLVPVLLPLNIGLVCFDFSGSGMSGGDYVSLGHHEKDDLSCIIDHMRNVMGFTRVALWGYSMGAVTCLMHAWRDPSLAGLVADSPFSDLKDLIEEIVFRNLHLPSFMLSPLLELVRSVIKQKANFDIFDVSPKANAQSCFVPALFLHGEDDNFVLPHHSEQLRSLYCGEACRVLMPDQDHGSRRPVYAQARCALFLIRALRWEPFIPEGIREDALEKLSAGLLAHHECPPRQALSDAEPWWIRRVHGYARRLYSSDPRPRLKATVFVGCGLCRAYQNATILPGEAVAACANRPGGQGCIRFELKFLQDDVEVAICWVRYLKTGARLYLAVASQRVLSISVVDLQLDDSDSEQKLECLALGGVETLALAEANLGRGTLHTGSLEVSGSCIKLVAANAQLTAEDEVLADFGCFSETEFQDLYFCSLFWGAAAELDEEQAPLFASLSLRAASPGAVAVPEPDLAKSLAEACLGTLQRSRRRMPEPQAPPRAASPTLSLPRFGIEDGASEDEAHHVNYRTSMLAEPCSERSR